MDDFFVLIRLCILILSCFGYMQMVCSKIKADFSISIVFCSIGSAVFLSGILNILKEASVLICVIGLYLFVKSIRRKDSITVLITPGTVFFTVSAIGMFLLLRGSMFVHDDNFSHWALATRVLLRYNRFPNFTDTNIAFQSYPLGYASFIYYICYVAGTESEWFQMYAQAVLIIASVSCLFAFSNRWYQSVFLWLGSMILLAGNTNFIDLLVDTLLPLVALGGFAFVYYYRDRFSVYAWWVIPYVVFLITIKNSGIFFSTLILVYMLHKIDGKSDFKRWCLIVLITMTTLLLWQKHVDMVFSDGLMSNHSMSVGYFEKMLGMKKAEDIQQILSAFLGSMFSANNGVWIACIFAGLMLGAEILFLRHKGKSCRELIVVAGISYVTYQLMLFGMYLFTMPLHEAVRVAGYDRYHDTILIFVVGVLLIGAVQQMAVISTIKKTTVISLAVATAYLLCVFYVITPYPAYYKRQDIYENVRGRYRMDIAEMKKHTEFLPGKRYVFLVDSQTKVTGFLKQLAKYEFDPSSISVQYVNKIEDPQKLCKDFDYIIGIDNTDEVNSFLTDAMGHPEFMRVISTIDG